MTPASERRLLQRQAAPLSVAARKIYNLKRALFESRDQGEDSETRASGRVLCPVCHDPYGTHVQTHPKTCPTSVGICTGERFKL